MALTFSCKRNIQGALGAAVLLVAMAPTSLRAKDLGMFYGEPTPALSMYIAQVNFAVPKCLSEDRIKDVKAAKKLLTHFNNGSQHRIYRKKDEDFVTNYEKFLANYSAAWEEAEPAERERTCEEVNAEIDAKHESFMRFAMAVSHMREQFSPFSEETIKRKQKWGTIAAVTGGALSAAASVTAVDDAVSSGRAGNMALSRQQFAIARGYNQVGGSFADLMAHLPPNVNRDRLSSVLDVVSEGSVTRVIRCPTVDHFYSYMLPAESPIWRTYQRVSMPCRNPTPADLQLME